MPFMINIVGQVKAQFQCYANNQTPEGMYAWEADYKTRDIVHSLV